MERTQTRMDAIKLIRLERLERQREALARLEALGLGDIPEARSLKRAIARRENATATQV